MSELIHRDDAMTYPEADRQYYLSMAGIRLWYAREPLPGAAPSPEFDVSWEEESRTAVAESFSAPGAQPALPRRIQPNVDPSHASEKIAHLQALMAGGNPETSSGGPAAPESETAVDRGRADVPGPDVEPQPEATPEEPALVSGLRLTLGFWTAEDMLLVSSISPDASERLQDALANNILTALGRSPDVKPDYVHWPVFANPLVPGNRFSDFSNVLTSKMESLKGCQLILMGVSQAQWPEDRDSWVARTLGTPVVDFPNTLAELAALPALKKAVWRELKPLARGSE
ncbi:hypothetical protein [Marinobacter sp.]|uniref:hypothetical protein n=1 Tax=Marinobacter sp. TaxID=50741 RepID=UPI0034A28E84